MGADVGVIVALAIDANQLAVAVVEGFAWAIAGGYGTCREREGDDIEDEEKRNQQKCYICHLREIFWTKKLWWKKKRVSMYI